MYTDKQPVKIKYFGISGRIPEEGNEQFVCAATTRDKAIAQFKDWLYADAKKERARITKLHGAACIIDSCFESDTPISVRD